MLFAIITKFSGPAMALFFSEAPAAGEKGLFEEGGLLNYPGLEAWKFLNLFLFIAVLYFLLRKPLGNIFRERRESIERELSRAKQERDAAEAKLAEVNARLAKLDAETAAIREQSEREIAAEAARIQQQTQEEIAKLREQAAHEITAAGKTVKQDLRRFAAEESVKLAEQLIRQDIRPDDDTRMVNREIQELGGVQ
jgi:F0F1-type ATP synthase membrane subunit b/b'